MDTNVFYNVLIKLIIALIKNFLFIFPLSKKATVVVAFFCGVECRNDCQAVRINLL